MGILVNSMSSQLLYHSCTYSLLTQVSNKCSPTTMTTCMLDIGEFV